MKADLGAAFRGARSGSGHANGALTSREKSAILAVWLLSMRLQMPAAAKLTARID
jgi:hypothetical protein